MAQSELATIANEIGKDIAACAADKDEADAFVSETYAVLKQKKLFSAMIPKELGGGGYRHSEMCAFLRALSRHCSSSALACSMHQHLVAAQVWNHLNGRPAPVLKKVVDGELVLVSTGANDWLESNGETERVDGGFRVSAKKPFASGSPAGDLLLTSAPYQDPQEGWQVLHFAVPLKDPAVKVLDDWKTLGMCATGSNTVAFQGVFIPEAAVALRRPRGAFHPFFNVVMTVALPLVMSAYVGAAEEAASRAREFARKRPLEASLPYVLGEMENELATAQLALDDMIRLTNDLNFEVSMDRANAVAIRKTIAAKAALATAEKALEAVGGAGFYRKLGIERLVRDLHGAQFHPLQEKRQHLMTGRLALGLEPVAPPTS